MISDLSGSRCVQFILIVLAITACGKKSKILIDGSSTVYPITEGIAEEYRKVERSVHVTVGISGTGGGFKKFCNGEIDISDASRSIKESESKRCSEKGIQYLEIPVAYDGLAILVNKDNDFVEDLTVEQLKKIFNSENPAKSWKEVDPRFPDQPLRVFSPGQDSGTFDYFVEAILGKDKKVRNDAVFSEDDNVLVTGISGEKFSIGFFGLAYYEENKDKLKIAAVVNPETKIAVKPNLETVKEGLYAPLSRPIFIYVSKKAKEQIAKFVRFYIDNAAQMSIDVGYIPLPEKVYEKNKNDFQSF